jgi:N-acetylmuramoyl-L-alanine amidase
MMKKLYLPTLLLGCLLCFTNVQSLHFQEIILVIDPGHGGKDPGKPKANKGTLDEKNINLAIALKVGGYVKSNIPNVKVLYTRTTDVYLSLSDRTDFANRNKADVFISIHANSNPKSHIQGTETHIYSHKHTASKQLATLIEKEFAEKAARKSRGVIDATQRGHNLYVTQYVKMPSVLVETGYLTNPQEEEYLNSEWGQVIIASAIYRGLKTFVKTAPPKEDRSKYYKVQILASSKPVKINASQFGELEDQVIEITGNAQDKYRYKYMVGREYDMERAKILLKKVKNKGFDGAFIVEMEDK